MLDGMEMRYRTEYVCDITNGEVVHFNVKMIEYGGDYNFNNRVQAHCTIIILRNDNVKGAMQFEVIC